MATMTLAQVQTIITSLVTAYTSLAATPIHSYSIAQRSAQKHKLAELRQEIEHWSAIEGELGGETGTTALGEFGQPQ